MYGGTGGTFLKILSADTAKHFLSTDAPFNISL